MNTNNREENIMNKPTNKIWNYLHLNKMLVRQLDKRWSYFICSLFVMYEKLEGLFEEHGLP